jgi:hypothetical protein
MRCRKGHKLRNTAHLRPKGELEAVELSLLHEKRKGRVDLVKQRLLVGAEFIFNLEASCGWGRKERVGG